MISRPLTLALWVAYFFHAAHAFRSAQVPAQNNARVATPKQCRQHRSHHQQQWGFFSVNNSDPQPAAADPLIKVTPTIRISDHAPSWDNLRDQLLSTPTGSRLQEEATLREQGLGLPHTDARLRLFSNENDDEKEEDNHNNNFRVTLYRDQAGWCLYCQKVWLFLEQKRIPYRVEKVPLNAYGDKPAWYTRKVDGGQLPAIELDGTLYTESMDIMNLLETSFPNHGPDMIPDSEAAQIKLLFELEDDLQRAWFSLTFYPVKDDALVQANQTLIETLTRVDEALGRGTGDSPWFLGGDDPSIVDIQYITVVERIAASVLYWKGLNIRSLHQLSNFQTWLAAWERLPSYLASRSDYYSHILAIPSQNGPGYLIPSAKPIANRISGLSGAWSLPLDLSLNEEPYPDLYDITSSSNTAKHSPSHESAYKVIENHDQIVRFACRGAGEPGRPSYHAELSDPYAEPNEDYIQAVDISLRHVVHALIVNDLQEEEKVKTTTIMAKQDLWGQGGNDELRENWEAYPDEDDPSVTYYWNHETGDSSWTPPTQQLDTCLTYLRDRVGVPRDMAAAAAMQLRAHLNWAIDLMKGDDF